MDQPDKSGIWKFKTGDTEVYAQVDMDTREVFLPTSEHPYRFDDLDGEWTYTWIHPVKEPPNSTDDTIKVIGSKKELKEKMYSESGLAVLMSLPEDEIPDENMFALMNDDDVLETWYWNGGPLAERFWHMVRDKDGRYRFFQLKWLS